MAIVLLEVITTMILLNASNLHAGGGIQVATSIIGELSLMRDLPDNLHIWASSEVNSNLIKSGYNLTSFRMYEVVDIFGANPLQFKKLKRLYSYSAVLTIFGPLYLLGMRGFNITGFAQGWIIYPDNDALHSTSFLKKLFTRFKFKIQTYFFKRSNILIVELEHVRNRLIDLKISESDRIKVLHNCLSSIYTDARKWREIHIPSGRENIKIGFVGRNYSHKNTSIIPRIKSVLKVKHNINVDFFVTFTETEWDACSDEFKLSVINVGQLYVSQCPSFYKKMDAVIFPSLLECFSATPLEAMAMSRPLFASDRPFNRDICGDYAYYFDPMSPEHAAQVIAGYFSNLNSINNSSKLEDARNHALGFSSPVVRAKNYLECLIMAAKKVK